jgi:hypothetical protein
MTVQQTQVVTLGAAGILLERLREFALARHIFLRETSQLSACRDLLQSARPAAFVLVLGRDLERELALLELAHACLPGTSIIVVGEADNPALAGLAWELGAMCALFPPTPMEKITEVLEAILKASEHAT